VKAFFELMRSSTSPAGTRWAALLYGANSPENCSIEMRKE